MIPAFAKKYNQLIIYVLFPKLFVTRETNKEKKKVVLFPKLFVTRETNKEKKKVIRPGLEHRTFRFQFQARYLLSYTATFHFLTVLFNSSSSDYW